VKIRKKIRKKITGGQGWAAFSGETQLNVTFCVQASVFGTTICSRNKRNSRDGREYLA
jgi:hypothetical protein